MLQQLSKKSLIILLIILGCLGTALGIYYAPALKNPLSVKEPMAYVVNVQKIWEELPATKKLKEDLQNILEQHHQEFSRTEESLRAEHQTLLASQRGHTTQEVQALEKKKSAFDEKLAQTQKDLEAKQASISQRHNQATKKLDAIIQEKIKEAAQKHKAALIVSSENVIYIDPAIDLTSQVYEEVKAATLRFHME